MSPSKVRKKNQPEPEKTFIEACLAGEAQLGDVEDYVESWHDSKHDAELHEFLGMDWDEYALWVEKPRSLAFIVLAHKVHLPVLDLLTRYDSVSAAARAGNREDAERIMDWLRETGRID